MKMKMPPQKVVQKVIDMAHSHGMPPPGSPLTDTTGLSANVVSLVAEAAKRGVAFGRPQLAERCDQGYRIPQAAPLHFADITTLEIPLQVDHWKFEFIDGRIVDLCLVGATRPTACVETIATDICVIAVFQICDHGESCPNRPRGHTGDIGKKDANREKAQFGILEFITLAYESGGKGICTLLSTKSATGNREEGITVTLMINPNQVEQYYQL